MDMGCGDLISGVTAIVKGFPLLLIAGGDMYDEKVEESSMLVVAKDSPIRAARDMIGPFVTMNRPLIRGVGYPNNVAADRESNKQYPVAVWYAGKAWIEADRARARRAVQAIYDTARWANNHRDDTFAILVRDGHIDGTKAQGMLRCPYATTITPAMVQPVLDIAYN